MFQQRKQDSLGIEGQATEVGGIPKATVVETTRKNGAGSGCGAGVSSPSGRFSQRCRYLTSLGIVVCGLLVSLSTFLNWVSISLGGYSYSVSGWFFVSSADVLGPRGNILFGWGRGLWFSGLWSLIAGTGLIIGGLLLLLKSRWGGYVTGAFGLLGFITALTNMMVTYMVLLPSMPPRVYTGADGGRSWPVVCPGEGLVLVLILSGAGLLLGILYMALSRGKGPAAFSVLDQERPSPENSLPVMPEEGTGGTETGGGGP